VAELGSVKAVREAPQEVLASFSWLPEPVAAALWDQIHSPKRRSEVAGGYVLAPEPPAAADEERAVAVDEPA
jgi:hypothetical protein